MKRLQILIDEDLDAALESLAHREHTSKAELIRRFVGERIRRLPPITADPLWSMIGVDDAEPVDIDAVVYE